MPAAQIDLRIVTALLVPMLASAMLFSVVTVALLFARARIYHYRVYRPMLLNLALAWIPIICVGAALLFFFRATETSQWITAGLLLVWAAFFPNSTYLVTEFHHLKEDVTRVPFWFDTIVILSLALCGVLLGAFSLLLAQTLLQVFVPIVVSWLALAIYLFISNVGIYIGRFMRFNSWDVVRRPISLAREVAGKLADPVSRRDMTIFATLFTVFLGTFYLFLYSAIAPAVFILQLAIIHGWGAR